MLAEESDEKANRIVEILTELLRKIDPDADLKIKKFLQIFRESDAVVLCEDCGIIFFVGKGKNVASEKRFVDWKMLSFRHVWDKHHKVVIYLPFLGLSVVSLSAKGLPVDPLDNTKVLYYKVVEHLRERMMRAGNPDAYKTFDEKWDLGSQCFCSICGTGYYDPMDACYCCYGSKDWLPFSEVNSIRVK